MDKRYAGKDGKGFMYLPRILFLVGAIGNVVLAVATFAGVLRYNIDSAITGAVSCYALSCVCSWMDFIQATQLEMRDMLKSPKKGE